MTNEQDQTPTKNVANRSRMLSLPEFDRFWDTVMNPWRPFSVFGRGQQLAVPPVDVFEKDGKLHVRAELPGMDQKDIDISISGDAITITGEKREEKEVKEENYYRSERSFGSFSRQVALPQGIDADQAVARFKDGVLEIEMPITKTEATRKVQITAGE